MIELGTIPIRNEASIVEARNKIRILAEDLGLGTVTATRMATITSELSRRMAAASLMSDIRVALDQRDGAFGLVLLFLSGQPVKALDVDTLKAVFDDVEIAQTTGGLELIETFKFLPVPEFEPAQAFIDKERQLVQPLSSEELYLLLMEYSTHLEERVEERSQQLQAKVSELETFSYGIAHDLRSPLVSIEGFSRLLREDILNHESAKVQEDIHLLETSVWKMHDFLNSTLEYSRAEHLIKRTNDVSFGKIVKEVITEFKGQISSIGATVSVADKFPRVCADRARIIQVLANLIQNSLKYRDKTVPLKIEIGHYLSGNEIVFFVRDNGPGIDASEAEKVFALFYRSTADGEGSGIGLAIVKKIIEAHGGRIWVQQGQSGKGTTMCFTLPEQGGTNKGDNNGKD